MLRTVVCLLMLANLLAWCWGQGWLGFGLGGTASPTAPPRAEVNPERVEILPPPRLPNPASAARSNPDREAPTGPAEPTPAAASSPSAPAAATAAAPLVCLEAGPFPALQQKALRAALVVLPESSWKIDAIAVKGQWLVYMGPFPDTEALERKRNELRRMRDLTFEELRAPSPLAPGLSLGRFTQEAQAQSALEGMRLRGIRTARVVTLRPAQDLLVVKVPAADAPLAARVRELRLTRPWTDCGT